MKRIQLAYGKSGLEVILQDHWHVQVVEPIFVPGVNDPGKALRDALEMPIGSPALRERISSSDTVGIIFNDITRATPNQLILAEILAQLRHVPVENFTLFNALGTHRENTRAELEQMLGADIANHYRIVQNNCTDRSTQVCLGTTRRGHEIWINRALAECSVKILTGFIEPHFFAGFSGGGKAIMPGMAGLSTILGNHSAKNIADEKATWGVTSGNPIWEEVLEVGLKAGKTFLVNVALNRDKEITDVFAGRLEEAHAAGCQYVKTSAMVAVDKPFDIVLTSNSGYPLDLNLYQSVKGMSAAAQVVRPGGSIVVAAECWDGVPDHGLFKELLSRASTPAEMLATIQSPGYSKQDQWQAQILAQILLKADIYLHSSYLSDQQMREAMIRPAGNLEVLLGELVSRYGANARICVLPEGPVTIPYVR